MSLASVSAVSFPPFDSDHPCLRSRRDGGCQQRGDFDHVLPRRCCCDARASRDGEGLAVAVPLGQCSQSQQGSR